MYAACTVPRYRALPFHPRMFRFGFAPASDVERGDTKSSFTPRANVFTDAEGYRIMIELPGVKKEDIRISFAEEVLTVSGEKKIAPESEESWIRRESAEGKFERKFRFRRPVDAGKISARFEDGVVEITLPLADEAKSQNIEIQ